MPLPILSSGNRSTPADLLRLYLKTELDWSRQVATEVTLEVGTALSNPELADVYHANCIFDSALPEGVSGSQAIEVGQSHFREAHSRCWRWLMNPSADPRQTQPLIDQLLALGHARQLADVLYLAGKPSGPIHDSAGLQIIPARASFRHAAQLIEEAEAADAWRTPQLSAAMMLHLDDPQTDALLALRNGVAVAYVAVLAVGELGLVAQLYVSPNSRRQGIGRTMMGRALEICARSLFRHVFLNVAHDNHAARALYEWLGFRKIGECVEYQATA